MMKTEIDAYLDDVRAHLHLDQSMEKRVIRELHAHLQEKKTDLQTQGLSQEEAARAALTSFGDSRSIARLMYQACSRGSWTEALISCQPHFMLAALFATHIWRSPLLLGAAFSAIVIIALLGWRNGSPNWLYSWIGYAVLPLLVFSYTSMDPIAQTVSYFMRGQGSPAPVWLLAALAAFYAFTIWLIVSTAVTVARRDWILVSLMLLPLPVLGIWVFSVSQSAGVLVRAMQGLEARFSQWDGVMAYFFVVLGVATALFVRLRQRTLKIGAVIVTGIVGGAVAAGSIWGDLGLFRLIVVSILLLAFLIIPMVLRALLGRDDQPPNEPLPS
jgi:hypothetical protein